MVVRWSSPLWKHKKQLGKHKKKKEKTRKTIYSMNSEKIMKTSFYFSKKNGFWEYEKHKKQKTPLSSNKFFVFFVFKNTKQFLKTRIKQTLRGCLLIIFKNNFKEIVFKNNFLKLFSHVL